MPAEAPLSTPARIGFGLLCLAAGTLPILAAFDVGPLHQSDIHGPPWLAGAAGGVFVLAGAALLAGNSGRIPWVSYTLMLVMLGAFAAMGNWIAFGPGPRECSGGFTAFMFRNTRAAAEFECRAAFGVGAVMLDGILLCMVAGAPKRFLGSGPRTDALANVGNAVLLVGLAPILLPLLLFGIGSGLFAGLREYLATGRWPRNEAMIERRRLEREQRLRPRDRPPV